MKKLTWCSDIHLDHLGDNEKKLIEFGESLVRDEPTAVLITGDISVASKLVYHLSALERIVSRPLFFLLGNHDFYGSSIMNVRKEMGELVNVSQHLRYLTTMSSVFLSKKTALVGADCFYDGFFGDWRTSTFELNDWRFIAELAPWGRKRSSPPDKGKIVEIVRKIANEDVHKIADGIRNAVKTGHTNIIVASHVPPFEEAHVHMGKRGDSSAMPWFTCKQLGDCLMNAASTYKDVSFVSLSGHTHGRAEVQMRDNLLVRVASADYGRPELAASLVIE